MTFVGWQYAGDDTGRLMDTNGLGMGMRGSNLPGAIASIHAGGCYSFGSGVAASGIDLGLVSDGIWFGMPANDDGSGWITNVPPQSTVSVVYMQAEHRSVTPTSTAERDCRYWSRRDPLPRSRDRGAVRVYRVLWNRLAADDAATLASRHK